LSDIDVGSDQCPFPLIRRRYSTTILGFEFATQSILRSGFYGVKNKWLSTSNDRLVATNDRARWAAYLKSSPPRVPNPIPCISNHADDKMSDNLATVCTMRRVLVEIRMLRGALCCEGLLRESMARESRSYS
jgi:hypothetical protein